MPELPEVETIRRWLQDGRQGEGGILGCSFTTVEVLWERSLAIPARDVFQQCLAGQTVMQIGRRGKFLLLELTGGWMLFHLRMSGDLRVESQLEPTHPHDRMVFNFSDGRRLVFNDARKFGRVWLVEDPLEITGNLGPEPLDPAFTPHWLYDRLCTFNRRLKPLLLDQTFLAGLGNIYTDEALFHARLHPLTLSSMLSAADAYGLWHAIRQVLQEGIDHHGASIDWVYRGGDFQNYFAVYKQTGRPCQNCGKAIERLVVGQRSTHFCPYCQPVRKK